ncbi:hypothetical protein V6N11_047110 [Hibiscus sabdariffa]|uniref:Amino acid transporter transmembrane domain-containing protein n=1 Tax=Hibiscus sabdariffa TaxID=183260 RepID=A0ABR2AD11_9ROSI
MLPEIQATVRQPAVRNMLKALYFQFSVGVVPMYAVTFIGYWAYGSSTPTYLLNSTSGPVWVKAAANISAFLQSVIALHIFASPAYEYLDTKFGVSGSSLKVTNIAFRVVARGSYLIVSTLVSALLPFLGDFETPHGSVEHVPADIHPREPHVPRGEEEEEEIEFLARVLALAQCRFLWSHVSCSQRLPV